MVTNRELNGVSDDLVPATLAAQVLRMSRDAVIRRVQRGELEGLREGGRWFVFRSSIEISAHVQTR
jgi:hypothetical protein